MGSCDEGRNACKDGKGSYFAIRLQEFHDTALPVLGLGDLMATVCKSAPPGFVVVQLWSCQELVIVNGITKRYQFASEWRWLVSLSYS